MKKTQIPIEIVELEGDSYHLFVQCRFNDSVDGALIIDTGASKTIFDSQILEPISELLEEQQPIYSAGVSAQTIDTKWTNIPSFQIGELILDDYISILVDLTEINRLYSDFTDKHICGLLGSDFLLQHSASIDFAKRILILEFSENEKNLSPTEIQALLDSENDESPKIPENIENIFQTPKNFNVKIHQLSEQIENPDDSETPEVNENVETEKNIAISVTEKQFLKVTNICKELFIKKMHDYGISWYVLRPTSVTDQISIKIQRIRTLETTETQFIDDNIYSEYIGTLNYAIIGLIQLEKNFFTSIFDFSISENEILEFYEKYILEAKNLMLKKNHDYGEAWRSMRISSYTDLILMKLLRIKQIEDLNGKTIISEGIAANYFDIINYSVFALIRLTDLSSFEPNLSSKNPKQTE